MEEASFLEHSAPSLRKRRADKSKRRTQSFSDRFPANSVVSERFSPPPQVVPFPSSSVDLASMSPSTLTPSPSSTTAPGSFRRRSRTASVGCAPVSLDTLPSSPSGSPSRSHHRRPPRLPVTRSPAGTSSGGGGSGSGSGADASSSSPPSPSATFRRVVWAPAKRQPLFPSASASLTQEIVDFANYTQGISVVQLSHARRAVDKLNSVARRLWKHASLEVFGSFATGLWLPDSDVDMVLRRGVKRSGGSAVPCLSRLAKHLRSEPFVVSVKLIDSAKVPVLKLVAREADLHFHMDITVDVADTPHSGLAASDMIRQYTDKLPELRPLVYVLKSFLRTRDLNEPYRGGLSSYSLALMVTAYLLMIRSQASLPVLIVDMSDWLRDLQAAESAADAAATPTGASASSSSTTSSSTTSSAPSSTPSSPLTTTSSRKESEDGASSAPTTTAAAASSVTTTPTTAPAAAPGTAAAAAVPTATAATITKSPSCLSPLSQPFTPPTSPSVLVGAPLDSMEPFVLDGGSVRDAETVSADGTASVSCPTAPSSTSVLSGDDDSVESDDSGTKKSPSAVASFESESGVSLGDLLTGFLQFYGSQFDHCNWGLSVRFGGFIFPKQPSVAEMYDARGNVQVVARPEMMIEDPLFPGSNAAASAYAYATKIVTAFDDAALAVKNFRPTPFTPTALSVLLPRTGFNPAPMI